MKKLLLFLKKIYKYKDIILFTIAILSFISIFYTVKVAKDIATKSRAYNKPIIQARIGNMVLNKISNHITIASNPKLTNEIAISTLTFYITNIGQENLENFFVSFKYHKMLGRKIFENLDFFMEGIIENSSYVRKFHKMGNNEYVTYKFNSINPGLAIKIEEPVRLHVTHIADTIHIKDKNGLPFSMDYTMDYEIIMDLSLSAKNTPNEDFTISYSIIDANSEKDFKSKLLAQFNSNRKKVREQESYFTYFYKLLFFNEYIEEVIIFPELEKITSGNVHIFFDEVPKIQTVKYEKYLWSLL